MLLQWPACYCMHGTPLLSSLQAPTAASDQDGSQSTDDHEVAVSADPDAEHKMMRGVLDSLLVDNEDNAQV